MHIHLIVFLVLYYKPNPTSPTVLVGLDSMIPTAEAILDGVWVKLVNFGIFLLFTSSPGLIDPKLLLFSYNFIGYL